jgi:RNA recognition motif. (a.k.a. RRM, RBD, or RNP domain)
MLYCVVLQISRPAKYPGPPTPAMTWPDVLARLVAQNEGGVPGGVTQATQQLTSTTQPTTTPAMQQPATRVLRLSNMLSAEDLLDEEGLADIEEETKAECTSFGAVRRVHIVRPSSAVQGATAASTGVGFVFVEFEDAGAARAAMTSLSTRTFDGKKVRVTCLVV